jgi:hypothetical protein
MTSTAQAQLTGTDTKPGDSCTSAEEGYVRRNASTDRDISEITLICDGSVWQKATGGGLEALQGTAVAGPCTAERNGLIKFNAGDDPPWQYCDGGTTTWRPFRVPQCQDDDAGACTLALLRSSNDPQFSASNIRCGSKLLGVTGTYGSGASNAFTWADVTNANPSTLTTTGTVSISGIPAGCPAEVEVSGQGSPQVSIAGGAWGAGGPVTNGQSLAVRLTSGAFGATNTAAIAIGSTDDAWSVTTRNANNCTAQSKTWLTNCTAMISTANHGANGTVSITDPGGCGTAWFGSGTFSCSDGTFTYTSGSCTQQTACDTTPDSLSFTDASNVQLSTLTMASAVTITGINTSAPVSVNGGGAEISINGGAWVTSGAIVNGQTLAVRLTSPDSFATGLSAIITVGSASDTWTVSTRAASSCSLPWGGTIAHSDSVTAYSQDSLACGGSCASHQTTRICNDGTLSNAGYDYSSCMVTSCATLVDTGPCDRTDLAPNYSTCPGGAGTACSSPGQICTSSAGCTLPSPRGGIAGRRLYTCQ